MSVIDPISREKAPEELQAVYDGLSKRAGRVPNFYGVMADGLNVGEESDRILISWQLDSSQAESATAGHATEPDVDELLRSGAAAVLSVGASGEPVAGSSSGRVLICQVPEDIVALRRAEPATARSWRLALRRALGDALDAGYRVSGATRGGWYVLQREAAE